MKQVSNKIAAVFMALVVFLSTMSFTVDMHYCGESLVDAALFSRASNCGVKMEDSTNDDCEDTDSGCCRDENFVVDGQEELQFDVLQYSLRDQQVFLAEFVYSYVNLFESLSNKHIPSNEYLPPNIEVNIQVLQQVFRI